MNGECWRWHGIRLLALAVFWCTLVAQQCPIACWAAPHAGDKVAKTIHVDKYGQNAEKQWKGKISSDEALKEFDEKELASFKGGILSKRLIANDPASTEPIKPESKGFFSLLLSDGRWWFLTPQGEKIFSLGVDCVSAEIFSPLVPKSGLHVSYDWMPEETGLFKDARKSTAVSFYLANLIRKWGDDWKSKFQERAISRMRNWGFNSLGNWSDSSLQKTGLPYCSTGPSTWELNVRYIDGDICDVYDPSFESEAMRVCKKDFEKSKRDEFLIGYFLDNELPWWNIPIDVFALPNDAFCKKAWIKILKGKYQTIENLNKAWKTEAPSFDKIVWEEDKASAVAKRDMSELLSDFAMRFYATWYRSMKSADPNHLVLGSRIPYPMDEIVDACARNTDVLSFNHYGIEFGDQFDAYYAKYGKPILIGEFNFDSLDKGLLKAAVSVRSQHDRGVGYSYYVENAAAKPYVIGTHYFQYVDEPLAGRADGENSYNGLLCVCDQPYMELVSAARETNSRINDIHFGRKAATQVKPAIP